MWLTKLWTNYDSYLILHPFNFRRYIVVVFLHYNISRARYIVATSDRHVR